APPIPARGHCPLDDQRLIEIFKKIEAWARTNPGLPVLLYGHSNGARLALVQEYRLREQAPTTPVHVTLIAGAIQGSHVIKILKKIMPILFGFLTVIACRQLELDSATNRELLSNVREPLETGVAIRQYDKYASLNDPLVHKTSALTTLNPLF